MIAALSLTGLLLATAPPAPARPAEHFTLRVLAHDWFQLGLGYDYKQAWQILQQQSPGTLAAIAEGDVESFDWPCQTLTLTPAASERLRNTLSQPPRLKRGEKPLGAVAGIDLEHSLYLKGFLLELDGRPLYGGVFLDALSVMMIEYPVIRTDELANGRLAFHIAPMQEWSSYADPAASVDPAVNEMRATLGESWDDHLKDPKYKARLDGFWAKLRDPRLQEFFARQGTLRQSAHCD
jgi:hypothetical protein